VPPPDPRSFAANILRASFQGIEFPVEEADSGTSHDGVGHKAYRVDGADFEPTGLNEESGTLTVPLFNGVDGMQDLWPNTWKRLLQAIRLNPIGTLVHPTRGSMTVFLSQAHEKFVAQEQDGVRLHLQWAQHNGNSTDQNTDPVQSPATQSAAACNLAAERFDAEVIALGNTLAAERLNADTPTLGNPLLTALLVASFIAEQFVLLDSAVQTAGSIKASFALMEERLAEIRAYPELRAAFGFGAFSALSTLGCTLLSTLNVYLPGLTTATSVTLSVTQTVWEVAESAYGTCEGVSDILDANTILDPLAIPPGTVLTIPARASDEG
jgi:prophage DNA circulation protein